MNRILGMAILCAISSSMFAGDVKFSEIVGLGQTNQTNRVRVIDLDKMPWISFMPSNRYEGRFVEYFQVKVDRSAERQTHPLNIGLRVINKSRVELDDYLAKRGRSIVKSSLEQSLRETLKDLPFVHETINRETFLAKLFRGSVGNTAEEEFVAGENFYSKSELRQWKEVTIEPSYGVRFDYAYTAFTITRHRKSLVFIDLRYRYNDLVTGDMEATAFEFLMSAPLGHDYFLSGGVIQRVDSDWTRRFNIKLTHKLPIDDGRVFAGFSLRQSLNNPERHGVIAGLEFEW